MKHNEPALYNGYFVRGKSDITTDCKIAKIINFEDHSDLSREVMIFLVICFFFSAWPHVKSYGGKEAANTVMDNMELKLNNFFVQLDERFDLFFHMTYHISKDQDTWKTEKALLASFKEAMKESLQIQVNLIRKSVADHYKHDVSFPMMFFQMIHSDIGDISKNFSSGFRRVEASCERSRSSYQQVADLSTTMSQEFYILREEVVFGAGYIFYDMWNLMKLYG